MNNQNEIEAYQTIDIENLIPAFIKAYDVNVITGLIMVLGIVFLFYWLFRWLR